MRIVSEKFGKQLTRVREKDLLAQELLETKQLTVDLDTGTVYNARGRKLAVTLCVNGYERVLYHGTRFRVHRLVAIAAHGLPDTNLEVAHINHVRDDNRAQNLRWVTRADNVLESVVDGRFPQASSSRRALTTAEKTKISEMWRQGYSIGSIARTMNCSMGTVNKWAKSTKTQHGNSRAFCLLSPDGVLYAGVCLKEFCEQHGLPYRNLLAAKRKGHRTRCGWRHVDPSKVLEQQQKAA